MAATMTHDRLIEAFEQRFDYFSARSVAAEVLESAGVKKSDAYDAGAVTRIAVAVEKGVTRPAAILARLATGGGNGPAGLNLAPAVEPKVEKPKVEAPVAAAPAPAPVAAAPEAAAAARAEGAPAQEAPAAQETSAAEVAPAADAHAEGGDKQHDKKGKKKDA